MINVCDYPLARHRGDTARCNLPFAHFGPCRLDTTHAEYMRTLAQHAASRGNTFFSTETDR